MISWVYWHFKQIKFDTEYEVYREDAELVIQRMRSGDLNPYFYFNLATGLGAAPATFKHLVANYMEGVLLDLRDVARNRNMDARFAADRADYFLRRYDGFTFEYVGPKEFGARAYQEYRIEVARPSTRNILRKRWNEYGPTLTEWGRELIQLGREFEYPFLTHREREQLCEYWKSRKIQETHGPPRLSGPAPLRTNPYWNTHSIDAPYTTHTVLPGDTLWDIARTHLGSGNRYPEIHRLNYAVIGPNPNLIHPGQVLRIPL